MVNLHSDGFRGYGNKSCNGPTRTFKLKVERIKFSIENIKKTVSQMNLRHAHKVVCSSSFLTFSLWVLDNLSFDK